MLSAAVEGEAARGLSPKVAWPTLALTALLIPAHIALLAIGLTAGISPWWLTLPLGISAYLHYTPAHEAIHRNIMRSRRFDPINRAIGWWSALLTGMTWPLLLRTHLAHHAYTNQAEDPDIFVEGSLKRLVALALLSVFTNLIPLPVWIRIYGSSPPKLGYLDSCKVMRGDEWRTHQIVHGMMCAAVWTAIVSGHGATVFALYVVPATIGRFLMGLFLSWLPHRPFTTGDRHQVATVRRGRVIAWATLGHSMHLVHHLWPRVPFYHYARLYRKLEAVLAERGVQAR